MVKELTVTIASAQYPITFFKNFEEWKTKTQSWVENAVSQGAKYLLFPEYGAMELTSLLSETERQDLSTQAQLLLKYLEDFKAEFQKLAVKNSLYIVAPSYPVFHSKTLTTNRVFVFSPSGRIEHQDKLFMTRFEDEQWNIQPGEPVIKVFQTADFKFAISTCFDVEFAFPGLAASLAGAEVLFAPSCTETKKGASRVHIGARARGLENQMYVVVSQTVGQALWSPAVDENYGYAGFYATPDVGFSDDGIISTGEPQVEKWAVESLRISHIAKVRANGAVFNFKNHMKMQESLKNHNSSLPIQAKLIDFK